MTLFWNKLSVLVIEDNVGDFVLIEEYLRDEIEQASLYHAKTFAQAKSLVASGPQFDVILLDLTLPDASGEELVNNAVRMAEDTALIVLTGYSNKSFGVKTLGLGVSDYLLKDDLSPTQLYKSIAYSIERKRINTELKESELKYRSLFHSSPLPTWVYDPDTLMFLDVNSAACEHYGYCKEEFLSMSIGDIRPKQDLKRVTDIIKRNQENNSTFEGTFTHFKKSGEPIFVNIKSSTIEFSGKSARLVVSSDITQKVMTENALKLSEQRFKALVQDGSDLICILDCSGNYKYISPTSESILGINSNTLLGKNAFEFIHEEDIDAVKEQFGALNSQRRMHMQPYRFKCPDGSLRWMETVVTNMSEDPAVQGIVANSRDVSERYTFEEKLRKQDALFRAIIEKGSDMKTLITPDGKIIFGTPSITRILGYTSEEYIGKNEREIVHPDDVEELFRRISQTISGERFVENLQLRVKSKSGEYRWCEKTITNLLDDPDVNAIVCDFWDITEKKKAEEQRESLIYELVQNNQDLRQFSYITSHNLRGPIASLLGLTNLISDHEIENPVLGKILEGIKKSAVKFDETISDLTTMLEIKDRPSIPREVINLHSFCKEMQQHCKNFIHESHARIVCDFSRATSLHFNKAYLESIFVNLLTNAIKYKHPNRPLQITVTSEVRDENIILYFRDNGIGFDKEFHKEKLFGLYQKFHTHVEGKGVGLFLVKSQMEALNGSIEVESKVGVGTLFTLNFRK